MYISVLRIQGQKYLFRIPDLDFFRPGSRGQKSPATFIADFLISTLSSAVVKSEALSWAAEGIKMFGIAGLQHRPALEYIKNALRDPSVRTAAFALLGKFQCRVADPDPYSADVRSGLWMCGAKIFFCQNQVSGVYRNPFWG